MATISNMTPIDVNDLELFLEDRKKVNANLQWNMYPQDTIKKQSGSSINSDILNKLSAIENKIDHIFGKSVLINGRFIDIQNEQMGL